MGGWPWDPKFVWSGHKEFNSTHTRATITLYGGQPPTQIVHIFMFMVPCGDSFFSLKSHNRLWKG